MSGAECLQHHWIPLISPTGSGPAFFVDRESLGKPARDTIVRHLQRDDVSVFVPERAAPVELSAFARRRRIKRDDLSKTDTKRSQAGQAQRAASEVCVI